MKSKGNVLQLEGRINNQILRIKGLKLRTLYTPVISWSRHISYWLLTVKYITKWTFENLIHNTFLHIDNNCLIKAKKTWKLFHKFLAKWSEKASKINSGNELDKMKLQFYMTIHLGSSKLWLWWHKGVKKSSTIWPFHSQDIFSISPYRLSYNSYDTGTDNLVLDQLASG